MTIARPSLFLDFANSRVFDARITLTRASVKWVPNRNGLLYSVPANAPAFGYNPETGVSLGVLLEAARTNKLLRSAELDNASWTKSNSTISATNGVAPDGTSTADRIQENGTSSIHSVYQDVTATVAQTWTFSAWLKADSRSIARMFIANAGSTGNNVDGFFDLSAGTVTGSNANGNGTLTRAGIEKFPNGWYRCYVTGQPDSSGTSARFSIVLVSTGTTTTYLGDSASGLWAWGAQAEDAAHSPSSYIPTTTAEVTRAADLAVLSSDVSWLNATEGTLISAAMMPFEENANRFFATLSVGAAATDEVALYTTTAERATGIVTVSSVSQATPSPTPTLTYGTPFVAGVAYAANNVNAAFNGTLGTLDSSGTIPSGIDRLTIGRRGSNTFHGNCYVQRVSYYPRRLADATLAALTA